MANSRTERRPEIYLQMSTFEVVVVVVVLLLNSKSNSSDVHANPDFTNSRARAATTTTSEVQCFSSKHGLPVWDMKVDERLSDVFVAAAVASAAR